MNTFAPDGYFREPIGPHYAHCGTAELRSFFTTCFSAGGGIGLQHCTVTDDGVRCALEYNCVRWGRHDLPPRRESGCTSAARTDCWLRPASTTTSKRPSMRRWIDASYREPPADWIVRMPKPGQWPAIWPPSMCRISPVMNGDDSRNRMPSTMSLT